MAWSNRHVDPQNGSESEITVLPGGQAAPDGTKTPILFCHGAHADDWQGLLNPGVAAFAQAGYPVIMRSLATNAWGSDTHVTRIEQMRAYAQSTWGAKAGKVVVIGFSMGGAGALNYAKQNLAKVAALVLIEPVLSIKTFHDSNLGGYASEIETAYGGASPYAAAADAHDPETFAATLAGIPTRIYYSSNSAFLAAIGSKAAGVAAAIGASASVVNMGAVGHSQDQASGSDIFAWASPFA